MHSAGTLQRWDCVDLNQVLPPCATWSLHHSKVSLLFKTGARRAKMAVERILGDTCHIPGDRQHLWACAIGIYLCHLAREKRQRTDLRNRQEPDLPHSPRLQGNHPVTALGGSCRERSPVHRRLPGPRSSSASPVPASILCNPGKKAINHSQIEGVTGTLISQPGLRHRCPLVVLSGHACGLGQSKHSRLQETAKENQRRKC